MLELVILIPLLAGALAFVLPQRIVRALLVLTGGVHLAVTLAIWATRPAPLLPRYFALAPEGLLSLTVISLLFFFISIYTLGYLQATALQSERVFIGSMLIFLATMTMVTLSDHVMVMWIAIEATTLASAPLIFSHRSSGSLEATWKYVLICSVGIALALLGSVLITIAMDVGQVSAPVSFSALTFMAKQLDPFWLKAGFVFILVGYGTKMGLAPMHTWLPDAHSEAPSPVSALLSGVLLNCAYLGLLKTHKIMQAAGLGDFSGQALIVFGLASMLVAATFILNQREVKRLLAYSSVENMGIIALGTGVGGLAAYGALLCLIHHSLIKSSLFMTSGNLLSGYGSRRIDETGDLARRMPRNFVAFFGGFAGLAGFPPFGLFIGELLVILGTFRAGHTAEGVVFVATLCVIFAGFAAHALRVAYGPSSADTPLPERAILVWPQYALLATSILLCCWMPEPLVTALERAAGIAVGGL